MIGHACDELLPGASLYKTLAGIGLCRRPDLLDRMVRVGADVPRIPGGSGLSLTTDPVITTWRELMRWMLVGSDNTSAALILQEIGTGAIIRAAADAGMASTTIAPTEQTIRRAVAARRQQGAVSETSARSASDAAPPISRAASLRADDADDALLAYAKEDRILGSLTTAADQVRLMTALWQGRLLAPDFTALVRTMLGQAAPQRISRTISYPGVQVAGKTGSWGPFRHHTAVVEHIDEPPVAVSVMTRSADLDRLLPRVDDAIGEMAAILVDAVRAELR